MSKHRSIQSTVIPPGWTPGLKRFNQWQRYIHRLCGKNLEKYFIK